MLCVSFTAQRLVLPLGREDSPCLIFVDPDASPTGGLSRFQADRLGRTGLVMECGTSPYLCLPAYWTMSEVPPQLWSVATSALGYEP